MKVLVTGAAGFIGGYLATYCAELGSSVLGFDINAPQDGWVDGTFERCDVRDFNRLSAIISKFRPQRIFHLAAQSFPTVSLTRPRETMDTNAGGTINLFESLHASGVSAQVVVACSSAEYGPVASQDLPVQESHPLRPLHPYGVSKVAQDLFALQYFSTYAIPTIRIRIFKTTGPGKLGDVCSDLTKRAVEMEMGTRTPRMMVGNLVNRRTIIDVRDLVRALWLSAEYCAAGEVYNLGGDEAYSVQELIDIIRTKMAFRFDVDQQPDLMRRFDELIVAGDNTKFRRCCAWKPEIQLTTTLSDMLDWWRARLGAQVPPQPSVQKARARNAGC